MPGIKAIPLRRLPTFPCEELSFAFPSPAHQPTNPFGGGKHVAPLEVVVIDDRKRTAINEYKMNVAQERCNVMWWFIKTVSNSPPPLGPYFNSLQILCSDNYENAQTCQYFFCSTSISD